jgi:hypothetical protein
MLSTSQTQNIRNVSQWRSFTSEHRAINEVHHQLTNAFFNSFNVSVLLTVLNASVCQTATPIQGEIDQIKKGYFTPTQVSSLQPRLVYTPHLQRK